MITLSYDQVAKIEILDKLFSNLDLEQLKTMAESELVVAKLKGGNNDSLILMNLIREHDSMSVDMMDMKNEMMTMKSDFQSLLRVLHTDVFSPRYNQDFQNLKTKHSIY